MAEQETAVLETTHKIMKGKDLQRKSAVFL